MTGTSHPDNDLLARADVLAKLLARYHPARDAEIVRDLAAEVRRLREQAANDTRAVECPHVRGDTSKWCDLAETEVSRLRDEVDTLRADQALDQEGHQRVCVPLETERDALRNIVRYWYDHAVKSFGKPDMREWEDEDWADSGWTSAEAAAIRNALADPVEAAALAAHNPQDGTDGD